MAASHSGSPRKAARDHRPSPRIVTRSTGLEPGSSVDSQPPPPDPPNPRRVGSATRTSKIDRGTESNDDSTKLILSASSSTLSSTLSSSMKVSDDSLEYILPPPTSSKPSSSASNLNTNHHQPKLTPAPAKRSRSNASRKRKYLPSTSGSEPDPITQPHHSLPIPASTSGKTHIARLSTKKKKSSKKSPATHTLTTEAEQPSTSSAAQPPISPSDPTSHASESCPSPRASGLGTKAAETESEEIEIVRHLPPKPISCTKPPARSDSAPARSHSLSSSALRPGVAQPAAQLAKPTQTSAYPTATNMSKSISLKPQSCQSLTEAFKYIILEGPAIHSERKALLHIMDHTRILLDGDPEQVMYQTEFSEKQAALHKVERSLEARLGELAQPLFEQLASALGREIEDRVEQNLTREVNKLNQIIQTQSTQISETTQRLSECEKQLEAFETPSVEHSEPVEDVLPSQQEEVLSATQARITLIEDTLKTHHSRLEKTDQNIHQLLKSQIEIQTSGSDFSALRSLVQQQSQQGKIFEEKIQSVRTQLQEYHKIQLGKCSQLETKLTGLEDKHALLCERLNSAPSIPPLLSAVEPDSETASSGFCSKNSTSSVSSPATDPRLSFVHHNLNRLKERFEQHLMEEEARRSGPLAKPHHHPAEKPGENLQTKKITPGDATQPERLFPATSAALHPPHKVKPPTLGLIDTRMTNSSPVLSVSPASAKAVSQPALPVKGIPIPGESKVRAPNMGTAEHSHGDIDGIASPFTPFEEQCMYYYIGRRLMNSAWLNDWTKAKVSEFGQAQISSQILEHLSHLGCNPNTMVEVLQLLSRLKEFKPEDYLKKEGSEFSSLADTVKLNFRKLATYKPGDLESFETQLNPIAQQLKEIDQAMNGITTRMEFAETSISHIMTSNAHEMSEFQNEMKVQVEGIYPQIIEYIHYNCIKPNEVPAEKRQDIAEETKPTVHKGASSSSPSSVNRSAQNNGGLTIQAIEKHLLDRWVHHSGLENRDPQAETEEGEELELNAGGIDPGEAELKSRWQKFFEYLGQQNKQDPSSKIEQLQARLDQFANTLVPINRLLNRFLQVDKSSKT